MLSASVNFTAVTGDTLRLGFSVVDQDGNAQDLTGITPQFAISSRNKAEALVESPASATVTVTDTEAGEFEVVVAPAVTAELSGKYRYHAILEDIDNNRETVARGGIEFVWTLFE